MKKIFLVSMVALSVLLTQCKKPEVLPQDTPSANDMITITLRVDGGSKADVTPENGTVTFQNGDNLYVAYQGAIIGTLTYSNSSFSGSISKPQNEGYKFDFYFFKGEVKDQNGNTPSSASTTLVMNISDQRAGLPIVLYNQSRQKYSSSVSSYSVQLANQTALAEFTIKEGENSYYPSGDVYIKNMNNKVTVNINPSGDKPRFSYDKVDGGIIVLNKTAATETSPTRYWAVLLPQEAQTTSNDGDVFFPKLGIGKFTNGVPEIKANDYFVASQPSSGAKGIKDPIALQLTMRGALPGVFTVATGKQVRFSMGNLQYIGSGTIAGEENATKPYWRFATNQWDRIGAGPNASHCKGNVIINSASSYNNSDASNACRDLFGYGASGGNYTNGSNTGISNPWNTITDQTRYDRFCLNEGNDWGRNLIYNGTNDLTGLNRWRTLTKGECDILIYKRENSARFLSATIKVDSDSNNDVKGVVVFPDNYCGSTSYTNLNKVNANPALSKFEFVDWQKLEALGCVFLPACYLRSGTNLTDDPEHYSGNYWTSTCDYALSGNQYNLPFYFFVLYNSTYQITLKYQEKVYNSFGFAVRLVRNVN